MIPVKQHKQLWYFEAEKMFSRVFRKSKQKDDDPAPQDKLNEVPTCMKPSGIYSLFICQLEDIWILYLFSDFFISDVCSFGWFVCVLFFFCLLRLWWCWRRRRKYCKRRPLKRLKGLKNLQEQRTREVYVKIACILSFLIFNF